MSDVFCPTPWLEMFIRPNGDVIPCCEMISFDTTCGNVNTHSFEEIMNHSVYQKIREELIAGKKTRACTNCWKREDQTGGTSLRTKRVSNEYIQDIGGEGLGAEVFTKQIVTDIKSMKIDFSNGCNLKCPMCNYNRSTAWRKDKLAFEKDFDFEQYEYHGLKVKVKDWDEIFKTIPLSFIDDNIQYILQMGEINISGGEPFFHPQFHHLLDKLVENNYKGNLTLITNLTLLEDDTLEKLEKLESRLSISIDGCLDLYEYVRSATTHGKYDWNHIWGKIQQVMEADIHISFSYTPQLYNMYNIIPWLEITSEFRQRQRKKQLLNEVLISPNYLRIANHPDKAEKDRLIQSLGFWDHVRGVKSIQQALAQPQPEDRWIQFCKFTNFLDKQRKTSIIKYVPQFEKYWITE